MSIDRVLCDLGSSASLMPLPLYKKKGLGEIRATTISLQLTDSSVKNPMGILDDVLIKVSDFCVLDEFIVVDMVGEAYTQIILGRPFLATSDCKIDVKRGRLTFDAGSSRVEFSFFEDQIVSPTSYASDIVLLSYEIEMDDVWCCANPPIFYWVFTKGTNLDYAEPEFSAPIPPSIIEERSSAFNECSLSAYCRCAQSLKSLPLIEGIDFDFDLGIEIGSGPFEGAH